MQTQVCFCFLEIILLFSGCSLPWAWVISHKIGFLQIHNRSQRRLGGKERVCDSSGLNTRCASGGPFRIAVGPHFYMKLLPSQTKTSSTTRPTSNHGQCQAREKMIANGCCPWCMIVERREPGRQNTGSNGREALDVDSDPPNRDRSLNCKAQLWMANVGQQT